MDSTKIEVLAANIVRDKITLTDKLRPFIKEEDKTPVWDGTVFLYNDCNHSNNALIGKVDVQVKGELNNDFNKKTIPFSVEIIDLNIYMNNGGVLYFVVYINKDNPELRKIYYEQLTPIKIKGYLKGKETQQTLTIYLKELPANKKLVESIFLHFYENSTRQYSFKDKPLISLDELTKRRDIKAITCDVLNYTSEDRLWSPMDALLKDDNCFYVEFKGSLIPHPIDLTNYNLAIIKKSNSTVFANGKAYENYARVIQIKEQVIFELGKSTVITFTKGLDRWNISYKLSNLLSHKITDLEFLINAFEAKEIILGNNELTIPFSVSDSDSNKKIDIAYMKKELKQYRRIAQFLAILHIQEDFDITSIEKNSNWNELMLFVKGIVDKEPISFTIKEKDTYRLNYKNIGNLCILFSLNKVENAEDLYYVGNYFDEEIILKIVRNDKEYISSVYSILTPNNYNEISNVNFPNILPSYKQFLKWNVNIFESANFDLLNLLLAYDKVENPKKILLKTAKDISEWIFNESGDEVPYSIKLINYFQTIKRERALNIKEQNQLLDLIDNNEDDMSSTAVYLLLNNQLMAERHFNKLDEYKQNTFKSFPIYKFWEES
jgi:hypothetical protein